MDFSAFDTKKLDEYSAQAKAAWGHTAEYKEYEGKAKGRSKNTENALSGQLMDIMREFGAIRNTSPESGDVQALVEKLRAFINDNFYTCGPAMLMNLGAMYAAGGEFTENIDKAGGEGTAQFAADAIREYCKLI